MGELSFFVWRQRMAHKKSNLLVILAFLLPSLLGFALFVFLPSVFTCVLSFTNYSGGKRFIFIGIKNYIQLFSDSLFLKSLAVTAIFVAFSVLFQLLLGLIFAVLLTKNIRGKAIFRSLFFLPSVLSSVAMALAFMLLFNPLTGPVNQFLSHLGIPKQPWFTSPATALGTIIFVSVWQSFGYYMVIFISGISSINPSIYESATLDGASPMRQFFRITLPLLSPTTFFCVTMAIIRGFQVFDQIYVMTGGQEGGGPAAATRVLVFDIYKNAFSLFRMGYASAEAVILLLVVLGITLLQYRRQHLWVQYDIA